MSELPKGWIEMTLGYCINLVGGGTPKTSISEYWNGDIPWLSVADFNDGNRWVSKTEKAITENGLNNSSAKLLADGNLIISARGTVGALAQLKVQMAFNQSCYGIKRRKKISDINFLYYLIKFSLSKIGKHVHGAVFDTITRQTFDNIEINLPPLQEQKAIAKLLSSFDEKIELLRVQNETLETLAQTIFKEWFVHFNYLRSEALASQDSYETSGTKVSLPAGWRVGTLGEEFDITMGQSPKGDTYNENEEGMVFYQGRAEFQNRFPKRRLYTINPKRTAEPFDVLMSVRAPVGDINVAFEKCCIGRGLSAIHSTYKSYALYKMKSLNRQFDQFESAGTVFGSINKASLENIEVIIPLQIIIEQYDSIASTIDVKIFNNFNQIKTLSKIRDTLLPKLMSGEIRVSL